MFKTLNAASPQPARTLPPWTVPSLAIALVTSGFALLVCVTHHERGLFARERASVWVVLCVCAALTLFAARGVQRATRRDGFTTAASLYFLGIIVAAILIGLAARACANVYPLRTYLN